MANSNAVFLIDDNRKEWKYRISSGWDFNPGSQPQNKDYKGMTLYSDGENLWKKAFVRDVTPVSDCKTELIIIVKPTDCSSFFIKQFDDKNPLWTVSAKDGFFYLENTKTGIAVADREFCICIETDLVNGKVSLYVDDEFAGDADCKTGTLTRLEIGFSERTKGVLEVKSTVLTAGFGICDKCFGYTSETASDKWTCSENALFKKEKYFGDHKALTYKLTAQNDMAYVTRSFDKITGKICFEIKYLTEGTDEKAVFSLLGDGKKLVSVSDENTHIFCGGKSIRKRHENVWQTIRIEADTYTKTAKVKVNGKDCGSVDFTEDICLADCISISYDGGKSLYFTDIFVCEIPEEPSDYVPEPVLPKKKDYTLGMNICSLWRNGHHVGWDTISPFDDIQTYLGTYDEGLPEVADWETKWLAEHGIDFGLYCWYNNEVNAPLFKTDLSFALEDGYFNSKYSKKIKFAILWEALNCARAGEEGFRNHVVPYWMDHYFSDDRYMTIDNKVVISVFGYSYLIKDFGSPEGVKRQLDYVRDKVKELGYDGAIFIACSGVTEQVKECGFDAVHAYSHGRNGYDKEHTKKVIGDSIDKDIIHVIPTISVGFNDIAWGGKRYPTLETADMRELVSWVKDDVLPGVKEDSWKKNTVMFSTWNEYGEGTYMMPSTLHGFGYLDEIRRGFTEEYDHVDVVPTEKQLERIGYIIPRGHALLRNNQNEKKDTDKNCRVVKLELSEDKWIYSEGLELEFNNGSIKGKSDIFDPQMIYKCDFPADALSVKKIKLRMRVDKNGGGDYVYFHFLTDCKGGGKWDMAKSFEAEVESDVIREYVFDTDNNTLWNGNITAFRFDPLGAEGSFELESIELVCDDTIPVIKVFGESYKTTISAVISDEGVFVPFDHEMARDFGIFCKWNRKTEKIYLEYNGKSIEFTKNSDIAVICGTEVKLDKPLGFYDGLPMLSLDVICKVFGVSYKVNGRFIDITK